MRDTSQVVIGAFLFAAGLGSFPQGQSQRAANADSDEALMPAFYEAQSRELMRQADLIAPVAAKRAPAFFERSGPLPARFVSRYVRDEVSRRLRKSSPRLSLETARAIIGEANRRKLDPLLVMAIIQHESRFNPRALGQHGEIGLMQMKPSTAAWVAQRSGIAFKGPEQLLDPVFNVRLGVAYVSLLRKSFRGADLGYLTAYNMGPTAFRAKRIRLGARPRTYVAMVLVQYRELRVGLEDAAFVSLPVSRFTLRVASRG